ncbi:MAG: hypothetical protein K8R02_10140 [Anaerohalosphaeraceae bacterium]|nr:hypothetical protein [Anaerohalosphaeraceae bacterium]
MQINFWGCQCSTCAAKDAKTVVEKTKADLPLFTVEGIKA